MEKLGITKHGVDETVKPYYPTVILDGHASQMGEDFLEYVTNDATWWIALLGAPYVTSIYQFDDDKRQNETFKMELCATESRLTTKKRVHGLTGDILPEEIVMVVKAAIERSFMVWEYAHKTLAKRGWYLFNRACLDYP